MFDFMFNGVFVMLAVIVALFAIDLLLDVVIGIIEIIEGGA